MQGKAGRLEKMQKAQDMASQRSSASSYLAPRIHVTMPYAEGNTRGGKAADLGGLCGYPAQPWQRAMLLDIGARSDDGTCYANPVVGGSIPRQCGKSIVGIVWCIYRAIAEGATVLWTDHNYSTTCEMYRRFRTILGTKAHDPTARYPQFNALISYCSAKTAQEAFFFRPPRPGAPEGSIHFATRTKSASLGYSFDLVVYDEAQELTSEQEQVILPTTTSGALHDLQFLYLGTPTRPGSQGTSFRELRADAMAGAEDTCWWEWGVDEIGDVDDEDRWRAVHPALESGVADIRAIRVGRRRLGAFGFAQEYLGYWFDAKVQNSLIQKKEWDACATTEAPEGSPAAYGVKFSPDGGTVAVAVALKCGAKMHVELAEVAPTVHGISALVHAIAHDTTGAIWRVDGKSGAQTLIDRAVAERRALGSDMPELDIEQVRVSEVTAYAQSFLDAVHEGTLEWYMGPESSEDGCAPDALTESVLTVTRRRIGSMGSWGFGGDNPTPAEAAAIAHWAAQTAPEVEEESMEVFFG